MMSLHTILLGSVLIYAFLVQVVMKRTTKMCTTDLQVRYAHFRSACWYTQSL